MAGLDNMFGSGKDPTTIHSAKNRALASRIYDTIGGYDKVKSSGGSALSDYISSYFSNTPTARTNTAGEIANVDRYFNGGAASELAGLRMNRSAAVGDAAQRAADMALASMKLSRAGGEGGPSSYDKRMALRSTGDIFTQAALDDAAQERNDWDFLDRNRLALTGQRTALDDALAARPLAPEQMRRRMFGEELGFLGQIGQIDQANTFYGLKNHPGIGESFVGDYGSIMDAY